MKSQKSFVFLVIVGLLITGCSNVSGTTSQQKAGFSYTPWPTYTDIPQGARYCLTPTVVAGDTQIRKADFPITPNETLVSPISSFEDIPPISNIYIPCGSHDQIEWVGKVLYLDDFIGWMSKNTCSVKPEIPGSFSIENWPYWVMVETNNTHHMILRLYECEWDIKTEPIGRFLRDTPVDSLSARPAS